MYHVLRDAIILSVLRRRAQGDCPVEPTHSVEMLEEVIHDLTASNGVSEGWRTIEAALAARDKKAAECPDKLLDPAKECPRCGALSNEGCRITILADAAFVHNVRTAISPLTDQKAGS